MRKHLFRRHRGRCFYCGRAMTLSTGLLTSVTIDHVVPKSFLGWGLRDNIVASCARCNTIKGDRPMHDMLRLVERLRAEGKELPTLVKPSQTKKGYVSGDTRATLGDLLDEDMKERLAGRVQRRDEDGHR